MGKESIKEQVKTLGTLLLFAFSGPSLIMVNANILRNLDFAHPLSLTLFTLCFCSGTAIVTVHFFNIDLPHWKLVTPQFYLQTILPIGALTGGTVVLGMSSYMWLTVAFVQMLKAFTPVMVFIFLILFKLDQPSKEVRCSSMS